MDVIVMGMDNDKVVFNTLQAIKNEHELPLTLSFYATHKLSDKVMISFVHDHRNMPIIAISKHIPVLIKSSNHQLIKSSLNWQSLTKRIVSAGRKSEILLQACKLTSDMEAMDGTAGFGHDGLILASTGAKVVMIEQNPLIVLMLLFEHYMMRQQVNWQKLLNRIQIRHGDFLNEAFMVNLPKMDLVYLDPMFPENSYSSKVNKNMQVLHGLTNPPSFDDEVLFLKRAYHQLNHQGRIIVKRPVLAPYLANEPPIQSIGNDAIRFDKYLERVIH